MATSTPRPACARLVEILAAFEADPALQVAAPDGRELGEGHQNPGDGTEHAIDDLGMPLRRELGQRHRQIAARHAPQARNREIEQAGVETRQRERQPARRPLQAICSATMATQYSSTLRSSDRWRMNLNCTPGVARRAGSQRLLYCRSMRRRQFIGTALSATGMPLLAQQRTTRIEEDDPGNIKLCHRLDAQEHHRRRPAVPAADRAALGARWSSAKATSRCDAIRRTQQRFARFGMRIYSGVHYAYRSRKVQLGQPGRDQDIETYRSFLRDLGELGIPVASYDFHPAQHLHHQRWWSAAATRRASSTSTISATRWRSRQFEREYSADEIWANYTYFIKAVLPVAEEARREAGAASRRSAAGEDERRGQAVHALRRLPSRRADRRRAAATGA